MPRVAAGRLALVLACVLVIALLALQVFEDGPVTRLDLQVTQWWVAHRDAGLTRAMQLVSAAHQSPKLLAATALLALVVALRGERRLLPRLLVVPAGMLLNVGLKNLFLRPRPHLDDPLVRLATQSFPSGHALASTVFYGAACALVFAHTRSVAARAAAVALAVAMVLLVAFSRVYLGAHYLSDVVAGIAEGVACLTVFLSWHGGAATPAADPR